MSLTLARSAFDPGPHAAHTVSGIHYCYDAVGNQTRSSDGRSIRYTAFDLPDRITHSASNKAIEFDYGASRERIRRKDIPSVTAGVTPNLVTHFVGNAEIVRYATGKVEVRRYVAGMIRVQTRESPTYTSTREDYVLTDAQGSTYAIVKDTGSVLGIMGFDPWGLRRTATNWTPLANPLSFDASGVTRHGYTGHEQVDEAGLIHMNGRIYDPKLMRFVQADPIIQSPFDSQSYNRYTYVFNNPLAHTDPTGYWGKEEQGYLRAAVAIVITIYTGGTAAGASWGLLGTEVGANTAFAVTVIGGAAAGAVQTGTLKGAATGAISGAMFFGIGNYFDAAGWAHLGKDTANALSGTGHAAKTLAHGVAGGITAELGGGNFGNGFISAGVTQAFAPGIDSIDGGNAGFSVLRTVSAAAVGETASALSGGKFANGAVTAAFARAFNDEMGDFLKARNKLRDHIDYAGQAMALERDDWNAIFPSRNAWDDNELIFQRAAFNEEFSDALKTDWESVAETARLAVKDHYMDEAGLIGIRGFAGVLAATGTSATVVAAAKFTQEAAGIIKFMEGARVDSLKELAGAMRRDTELALRYRQIAGEN